MRNWKIAAILMTLAGHVLAQTTSTDDPINDGIAKIGGILSAIFSPKATEIGRLVDEGKFEEADAYLTKEQDYFRENRNENLQTLKKLSDGMSARYEPQFSAAIERLVAVNGVSADRWDEARRSIEAAIKLQSEARSVEVFKDEDLAPTSLTAFATTLAGLLSEWQGGVAEAFLRYDHSASMPFFNAYPVAPDESSFFDANLGHIQEMIRGYTLNQSAVFARAYAGQVARIPALKDAIESQQLSFLMPKDVQTITLAHALEAIQKAKEVGFVPKSIPGIKIGFAETTSKTLLKEGHIEFPAQVEMDLPLEPMKADIDELFATEKSLPDYLVVFDVAKATTSRRILSKTDTESKYVSGTTADPNPDYEVARSRLFEAQAGLARAQSTYTQGAAAAILNALAIAGWRENVNRAEANLRSTPSTVSRDLTNDYRYATSEVRATRTMTTNYYIVDRIERKYFKGIFDTSETKTFRIAFDVHDKDPNRQQVLGQFDSEEDITRYEQAPMTVAVSGLIGDYWKHRTASKPLPPLAKLRKEMLDDKNRAIANFKAQQFDGKPIKDPRFDSVVVILNPKGALGAGFFVKPNLVLTNYHVVEGIKFVEMKMFNGMETFGKVVKSDVRLDLALIKVQDQGVPVQFYDGNTIDLGSTLEAIGHPKGLTFSISRGVASAVRKKRSVFAVGGKDVLFVQTDAAINPGNSGGPLFLGHKVVGVNNNKMVGGAEGLGFAVHYAEVGEFLKETF